MKTAADAAAEGEARIPMDIVSGSSSATARRLAGVLGVALLASGCGEETPVNPDIPLGKGYIAGKAFVDGAPERTSGILIKIFPAETNDVVSTTFPNDDGDFVSDALDGGRYDITASVADDGYVQASVQNIVVVAGNTTRLRSSIIVPDTSTIRFTDVKPAQSAALVGRRPEISGEFSSGGSGFKIETFVLRINEVIQDGVQVEVDPEQPRRFGSFRYTPPLNLLPGVVTVGASMSNRAGTFTRYDWSFSILDGISRRVPGVYSSVDAAVGDANDGDTILVAPGTYDVLDVVVNEDLHFLAEGGRDVTTLRSSLDARHFYVFGQNRTVRIEGFTLTGGFPRPPEQGGSIFCDEAHLTIESCHFDDNQSGDRGGALAIHDAEAVIRDCIFTDNRAYRGGAIAIFDQAAPEVEHCLFSDNTATNGLGGAIQVEFARPNIHHNTFYRNDVGNGKGSAIMIDFGAGRSDVRSHSNLFVENLAAANGGGTIHFNESELSSICDGFFNNVGGSISGRGSSPIEVDLLDLPPEDDPRFCDLAGGDVRLQPDSPFLTGPCERGAFPPGCGP